MNIGSSNGYPSANLSNFHPHQFELDGVQCNSFEGFIQSVKFKDIDIQNHVCTLVGIKAKRRGGKKKWFREQKLYWQGVEMARDSQEYQDLLDRAYLALAKNTAFRKALLATGNVPLTHSIGKTKQSETVLTIREFCGRLEWIRGLINKGEI
ncbi:MAG: hypothetical protein ACRCW1_05110 [Anaerotignaceae bacterium]